MLAVHSTDAQYITLKQHDNLMPPLKKDISVKIYKGKSHKNCTLFKIH